MTISPAGFFAKWCILPTCKAGQGFKWSVTKKPRRMQFLFKDSKCVSNSQTEIVRRFEIDCCFCRTAAVLINYIFPFFVPYLQWEHIHGAPKIWLCTHNYHLSSHILYTVIIYTYCFFNIISEYTYKIHFSRNTSSNLHIYSTNFKVSNDFNTILTHSVYLLIYVLYKYWCPLSVGDPHRVETCEVSNALNVKTSYYNILNLLVFSLILIICS